MAGYDPRRPRPSVSPDDPSPVEAIIDLADHRGSTDHSDDEAEPVRSGPAGAPARPVASADEGPASPRSAGDAPGGLVASMGFRAVVVAAVAVVVAIVVLRRRR